MFGLIDKEKVYSCATFEQTNQFVVMKCCEQLTGRLVNEVKMPRRNAMRSMM